MGTFFAPNTYLSIRLQDNTAPPVPVEDVEPLNLLTFIRDDTLLTSKSTASIDIAVGQPVVIIVNVSVTSTGMTVNDGTNTYTAITGSPFTWGTGGRISVFICEDPRAVTGPVTVSWSTAGRVQISVFQGTNLAITNVLDVNPPLETATSIGMTPASSGTLGHDNVVVFAVLTHQGAALGFVNDPAWTESVSSPGGGNTDFRVSQRLVHGSTSAVTYDADWTNSRQYGVKLFAVKGT